MRPSRSLRREKRRVCRVLLLDVEVLSSRVRGEVEVEREDMREDVEAEGLDGPGGGTLLGAWGVAVLELGAEGSMESDDMRRRSSSLWPALEQKLIYRSTIFV